MTDATQPTAPSPFSPQPAVFYIPPQTLPAGIPTIGPADHGQPTMGYYPSFTFPTTDRQTFQLPAAPPAKMVECHSPETVTDPEAAFPAQTLPPQQRRGDACLMVSLFIIMWLFMLLYAFAFLLGDLTAIGAEAVLVVSAIGLLRRQRGLMIVYALFHIWPILELAFVGYLFPWRALWGPANADLGLIAITLVLPVALVITSLLCTILFLRKLNRNTQ